MITAIDPVGSWSWETRIPSPGSRLFVRCARQVLDTWSVLRSLGLAEEGAQADITVHAGHSGVVARRVERVPVEAPDAGVEHALLKALGALKGEDVGPLTIGLSLPGPCVRDGVTHHVQRLFAVSVDMWPSGAATTTLHTFSDAWMSHDVRGHRQPDVRRENAPRPTAALSAVTELTGAPVEPWDPGGHGVPTEDGFGELPDDDPDLLDSWYMFEIPRRTERLEGRIPQGAARFETTTESPVDSVEVRSKGRVLGYLWAAEEGDAAGCEPKNSSGHAAFDAAVDWLTRLSEAKRRGLSPSEALCEAMNRQGTERFIAWAALNTGHRSRCSPTGPAGCGEASA